MLRAPRARWPVPAPLLHLAVTNPVTQAHLSLHQTRGRVLRVRVLLRTAL